MSDVSNLRNTITPKSDQLNADDLIGTSKTITVTAVKSGPPDQPVTIHYEGEEGRPYKPCKSMRRVLIHAWGDDGRQWASKSMTLYCDPEVKFGGVKTGGIRISHLSHIEKAMEIALTVTRGKRAPYNIKPLQVQQKAEQKPPAMYPADKFEKGKAAMQKAIQEDGKTPDQVINQCQKTGPLTDEQLTEIRSWAVPVTAETDEDADAFNFED